jgi:hypothetical protein
VSLLAHAAPISYRFPLPIWLYGAAAAAAVLVSAPVAALAVTTGTSVGRRTRDIYPYLRRVPLGRIVLAVCSVLLVWGIVGAYGASGPQAHIFFENPMTVLTWVDFWVGIGLLATFVGDVWDFVSPLNALARVLDRALARRSLAVRAYPAAVGRWPAVALLLVWSWCELVWEPGKDPPVLASLLIGYFALTLAGVAVFGAAAWLDNVEVFTVLSRTFARFAPAELNPAPPDGWLETPPESRSVRLRAFGVGAYDGPPMPRGGGAFVIALLATVIFDGYGATNRYTDLAQHLIRAVPWLGSHTRVLATLVMLGITVGFFGAYLLVCALATRNGTWTEAARAYAPTLVPIAAVYFVAHYFTYFLIGGQDTLAVLVDPFAKNWNPLGWGEYPLRKGFLPPAAVWWVEVLLIVCGHVVAVFAAHRVALLREPTRRVALRLQLPLVVLMVGFTFAGLWVLAQQLRVGD